MFFSLPLFLISCKRESLNAWNAVFSRDFRPLLSPHGCQTYRVCTQLKENFVNTQNYHEEKEIRENSIETEGEQRKMNLVPQKTKHHLLFPPQ